jgi:hypothetical protein
LEKKSYIIRLQASFDSGLSSVSEPPLCNLSGKRCNKNINWIHTRILLKITLKTLKTYPCNCWIKIWLPGLVPVGRSSCWFLAIVKSSVFTIWDDGDIKFWDGPTSADSISFASNLNAEYYIRIFNFNISNCPKIFNWFGKYDNWPKPRRGTLGSKTNKKYYDYR